MVKNGLLLWVTLLFCPEVSASQSLSFRFAEPLPDAPSVTSEFLGMKQIKVEGFVVYYAGRKENLAREISDVLSTMHKRAYNIVGVPLAGYGVVLVDSRQELPKVAKNAHWLNVDGIPSIVRAVEENSLPLRDELSAYLLFPFLIHESVDVGLKNAYFAGHLTETTVSSRWIIEGIADYSAHQAVLESQKTRFTWTKKSYLAALSKIEPRSSNLNLENAGLWWPFPNAMPDDVPQDRKSVV